MLEVTVWVNKRFIGASQQTHDVVLTSMRLNYVALTSVQRHFDGMCPLGFRNKLSLQ